MEYIFELEMQVRDYECDMEGIVNNAIYQHYLEHTRHEFLASSGISFILYSHLTVLFIVPSVLDKTFSLPSEKIRYISAVHFPIPLIFVKSLIIYSFD